MKNTRKKLIFLITLLTVGTIPILTFATSEKNASDNKVIHPLVTHQLFEKAKENNNIVACSRNQGWFQRMSYFLKKTKRFTF